MPKSITKSTLWCDFQAKGDITEPADNLEESSGFTWQDRNLITDRSRHLFLDIDIDSLSYSKSIASDKNTCYSVQKLPVNKILLV